MKKLRVPITPPIQRAAELRGIPVNLWVQAMIHKAAWNDIVEARDILENAGFADRNDRLRREGLLRDKYRLVPDGTELKRDAKTGKRTVVRKPDRKFISGLPLPDMVEPPPTKRRKEKLARIEILPYQHVDHTRFHGPNNPCVEPRCSHCHPAD
jgi:hypothetical protein